MALVEAVGHKRAMSHRRINGHRMYYWCDEGTTCWRQSDRLSMAAPANLCPSTPPAPVHATVQMGAAGPVATHAAMHGPAASPAVSTHSVTVEHGGHTWSRAVVGSQIVR